MESGFEIGQVRPLEELAAEARRAVEDEAAVMGSARPLLAPSSETAAADDELDMAIYVADLAMTKRRRRYAMAAHLCRMVAEVKAIEANPVAMGAFDELMRLLGENGNRPDMPAVTAGELAILADAMEVALIDEDDLGDELADAMGDGRQPGCRGGHALTRSACGFDATSKACMCPKIAPMYPNVAPARPTA